MKTILIALTAMCLLTGCPGTIPRLPDVVEVPIATKCDPSVKVTPINDYAFDRAKKEMSFYEKLQLAVSELHTVKGQNTELTAALKECTK